MAKNINKSVTDYISFMQNHFAQKNSEIPITHTLMGPLAKGIKEFKGSYVIEGSDYEKFIQLYKNAINYIPMHIVERPKEVGPLVIDLDFNTNAEYNERQYLDKHIEYIVEKFNKKIYEYFNIDEDIIKAFVTEKPAPTHEAKKNIYKDGFHIMYPDIPMDVKMRYFLLDNIKAQVNEENGFADIPFINTLDQIFDPCVVINNGILMFGSQKEEREPYALTKIYNYDMTIDSTDNYDNDELISIMSLRRYDTDDKIVLSDKYNTLEMKQNIDKVYLKYNSTKKEKEQYKEDKIKDIKEKDNKNKEFKHNPNASKELVMAKKILLILSKERADDYIKWLNVGWACHNISNTLLPDFIQFSKKSSKYETGGCEKIWNSAKDEGYTFASLYWWGQIDNPKGLLEILREQNKHLVKEAESGTHNDIAILVFEMYKYIFKCVSILKNIWYEYQDNRWIMIEDGYTLSEKISTEVAKEFCALQAFYFAEASQKEDIDTDYLQKKSAKMAKTYEKLKSTDFAKNVLKACARKFYDNKFEEKLDTNPNLLGFDNGIYDLKNGCFRKGLPDDNINMSTNYDYNEYTEDAPEVKEIMNYFHQVQQEKDSREYLLRLISSFLDGYNKDQKFVLWTGSGCHEADTKIKMFDGTVKNIQDIELGDQVLGDDSRQRKVSALYIGESALHTIILQDAESTKFRVNLKHRLAVRCYYKYKIEEIYESEYDSKYYIIKYHKKINTEPVIFEEQFTTFKAAEHFLLELNLDPDVIHYGDTLPMTVETWNTLKEYEIQNQEQILCYYKMYSQTNLHNLDNDISFTCLCSNKDKIEKYYGIELDGNKKYVMENNYITYNSNGKSTTIDLIHNTLGKYSGILPITVLTRRRGGAGNANPELADKKGKRFLVIQEPEHDDVVYVGQMKELVAGNDTIYARALYGNPFEYKPQFKLILICNKLPNIPSNDGGTWRRLRVLPFESAFVDTPIEKNEFKKDGELTEKMKSWGSPFSWLLLNKYYPTYVKTGLSEPPKVTQYTNQYKKDSDYYFEFISDCVDITNDDEDIEKLDFLYGIFKKWFASNFNSKIPPKKEMVSYITSRKDYKVIGDTMIGIKAKCNVLLE